MFRLSTVSNALFTNVIPFKNQINTFGWNKFSRDFPSIKFKADKSVLLLEFQDKSDFSLLQDFFTQLEFNFTSDSTSLNISFEKEIILPTVTEKVFFEILYQYFFFNTSNNYANYCSFINSIIADLCTHIRIVSPTEDTLYNIIEYLKRVSKFEEVKPFFDSLLKDEIWKQILTKKSLSIYSFRTLSIHTWLHIIRRPSDVKSNFKEFLIKLQTMTGTFSYVATSIPLIDPFEKSIFCLTFINEEVLKDSDLDSADNPLNYLFSYWFTLSSLILRNINYALLKFPNLSLTGLNHTDIEFYDYFKPKMTQFSESCYNDDLVEAFKLYDSPKGKFAYNIRGHDLYTYNRSTILDYHLKQAQIEFNKFPYKKILRKRVNRRSNRLYEFLNLIIILYKNYLNEVSSLTKASGNYSTNTIDKIIDNDKFLN